MLDKIGRSIPKHLLEKGMRDQVTGGDLRERMEWAAKKRGDSKLLDLVNQGAFDAYKEKVVDEQGSKAIEKWVEDEVKHEIVKGNLAAATKDELNEWKGKK